MCGLGGRGSRPRQPEAPPPRAMARTPQRVIDPAATRTAGAQRRTIVNRNPDEIRRAMTANLGGTGVVLGA